MNGSLLYELVHHYMKGRTKGTPLDYGHPCHVPVSSKYYNDYVFAVIYSY
jgi:hypothetical protein